MKTKHRTAARAKRHLADPNAMHRAISYVQPFAEDELHQLQLPVRMAYERLRTGMGSADDFETLAAIANVALVRSEAIDPLCVETCQRAQDALLGMLARHKRVGRWGVDSAAMRDIPPVIDLYEQLLTNSTPLQMAGAMTAAVQRMRGGQVLEA